MFSFRIRLSKILYFLSPIICLLFRFANADGWTYQHQNEWSKKDKTCSGDRQSPIDIETKIVSINKTLKVEFKNYDNPYFNYNIDNNGHSVQFNIIESSDDTVPYITGTALNNERFNFAQLHFHWASGNGRGSEHAFNGKHHSMEMHLVHYNRKYNLSEAMSKPDGLTVIGILFDVTRKNNMYMDPLIQGVNLVKDEKQLSMVRNDNSKRIILDNLLPNNLDLFFRYQGSLTTPPCSETVNWIVYSETNDIGVKQMEIFREVAETRKVALGDTFRELQSTRDRKIEASASIPFNINDKGFGNQLQSNQFIITLSMITSLLYFTKI